ncbi:DUF3788 domain-containing protein [Enterococcus sp. AZ103]|uniref:DUF3788 domain-containing protein n=1 Tax=Enterococcus sp. AZ103 TaxID=2774628 RepID=UPI003F266BA5
MWDKFDRANKPTMDQVTNFVQNPLWNELTDYIMQTYNVKPLFEYSGCNPGGWNVKFRKAGRSLCTLYPMENYFICLIVISQKEKADFNEQLESSTPYLQDLNNTTKEVMDQKWLMINVKNEDNLPDIKQCLAIRAVKRKI